MQYQNDSVMLTNTDIWDFFKTTEGFTVWKKQYLHFQQGMTKPEYVSLFTFTLTEKDNMVSYPSVGARVYDTLLHTLDAANETVRLVKKLNV